ncbi:unnamed protein product [Cuscuta europaea]|uniref:Apple domain-containing protein n=1 Tax=Cuscuta europaea TaxID=41803 RepID=A0A9P0ZH85_CUSEU|nr:unnamed protein product [Cuscuta europaea]
MACWNFWTRRSGNLVLMDSKNTIKWQSFNFPTNTILWGQRLSPMTRLTAFPISNSSPSFYYSLEIHDDKLALYLNSGNWKYSYWEYRPSDNRNITYACLTSQGLEIYNGLNWRITQITSKTPQEPPKFLALADATGNLGLYYYSPQKQVFEVSYEAINNTCYLPFACNKSYGICTSSGECSCIRLVKRGLSGLYCCNEEMLAGGSCDKSRLGMIELHGITTVLSSSSKKVNLTKAACADLCLNNCTCVAAMYGDNVNREGECYFYGLVRGVKQMGDVRERKMSYMVKVPKDVIDDCHGKGCPIKTWVLVVVGVVDGLVILILSVGIGYCVVQRRKNNIHNAENNQNIN